MDSCVPSVAVIGCGSWGQNLVRNFNQLGFLALVCDIASNRQLAAKKIAPHVNVVTEAEQVFSSSVSSVVIATPSETHYELTRQALKSGKDVFVEKPLALTYEQGVYLVRLAQERERILMVGHVLEYHPAILRLLELVQSGELGETRYISANRLNLGRVRKEENILWSFAPHDIAIILRITGEMPSRVIACGGNYIQPHIADITVTHLMFRDSIKAHIYVSWLHPFKEQRLILIGSEKMVCFDGYNNKLVLYNQRVEFHDGQPIPIKNEGQLISFEADEPLHTECKAFLNAISTRHPPVTDGHSGLRVLQILQAAQSSLSRNCVPVDLSVNR